MTQATRGRRASASAATSSTASRQPTAAIAQAAPRAEPAIRHRGRHPAGERSRAKPHDQQGNKHQRAHPDALHYGRREGTAQAEEEEIDRDGQRDDRA
jgi:hypothetical protein